MKSYQIVFFDASGAQGTRAAKIPVFALPLAIFFTLVLVMSFLVTTFLILNINREITVLRSNDFIYSAEKNTMNDSIAKLENVVDYLQQGNIFVYDIFKTPVISTYFDYREFSQGFEKAELLRDLIHIDNKRTYRAIPSLMRVIEMMNSETDKRKVKYMRLFEYLEEQNIIFAHTPSIWPSSERTTSGFGFRRSPFTGVPSYHEGTDFGAQTGTLVRTTADGIVVFAGARSGYGYLVTIDHGFGYMTRYAHNSRLLVRQGDFVKKGDIISLSGATGRSSGAHLHYEVLYNGCPVNSFKFLPKN